MSRTYDALKKAELRRARPPDRTSGGRTTPGLVWELPDDVKLQYERMQLWLTNRAAEDQPIQAIMIASCERGNGATTTAARLALTIAEQPTARVLLVDANLRTPSLNVLFGTRGAGGFSELVMNGNGATPHTATEDGTTAAGVHGNGINGDGANGDHRNDEYIQPTIRPNLFVLPTGRISAAPLELFTPAMVGRLVTQLKSRFDFVLFDAPPLLEFPDGFALARHVDAALLVVEAERTTIDNARRVIRDLERAGVRPAGVVLNRQRDYMPRLLRRLVDRVS